MSYSQNLKNILSGREKVGGEKGGERRGVGSVVNLVRGFPSHCGKPIGFSIVAALSMPRSGFSFWYFFFCEVVI